MANDREKEAAARASLRFVRDGDIVGLGTGSTAAYAVRFLGERVQAGLKIRGIPTSIHTQELAATLGIPLTTLDEFQEIDVTIDGADEVDPELRLIKGGGGALLREKIVASATRKEVIIADSSKQVPVLGKFPVPVEIIKFAETLVAKKIAALGAVVKVRRDSTGKPFYHRRGQSHSRLQLRTDSRSARPGPRTGKHARGGGARFVYRDGRGGVDRQGRSGD